MKRKKKFRNRTHAGAELAIRLQRYSNAERPIVVGLSRGGVLVAAALSEKLKMPCCVFVGTKISKPEDRRFALGAVTETGHVFLDEAVLSTEPWLPRELRRYIEEEIRLRKSDVARKCASYRADRPLPDFHDRTVIAVDEGTFSGATFVAAIQSLRDLGARSVIGGLPVATASAAERIRHLTDELVVLVVPGEIENLADYYDDFAEVGDDEIVNSLAARYQATDQAEIRGKVA